MILVVAMATSQQMGGHGGGREIAVKAVEMGRKG